MNDPNAPVYVVLGASGGIGAALTRRLAASGAHLFVAARRAAPLRALADEVGAEAVPLDATDYEQVAALVTRAVDAYGRLDGIANCVGSVLIKPAHLTSVEAFTETLAVNLHTAFHVVKAAARPMMARGGGSIVLCSSAVARTGIKNHEAIAAAKAGVAGLVRSAAATYANRGVRVNCVAPGLVQTPQTAALTSNETARAQSVALHALGRLGEPEDVAAAVAWLLDAAQSGWVTGQEIGVDGGLGTVRSRN